MIEYITYMINSDHHGIEGEGETSISVNSQFNSTLIVFACSSLIILLTIFVFTKITKYNDWEEVKKGNLAAAMVLGGNIFGIGNIMRFAITTNANPLDALIWGLAGLALLVVVHLIFERLAPHLDADEEIHAGNTAIGFIMLALSVAFSYIIGASIS